LDKYFIAIFEFATVPVRVSSKDEDVEHHEYNRQLDNNSLHISTGSFVIYFGTVPEHYHCWFRGLNLIILIIENSKMGGLWMGITYLPDNGIALR